MTKPIPQREPMLALPPKRVQYIAVIDSCGKPKTNSRGVTIYYGAVFEIGKWAELIDYKKF